MWWWVISAFLIGVAVGFVAGFLVGSPDDDKPWLVG
jgi:hypothetical protein